MPTPNGPGAITATDDYLSHLHRPFSHRSKTLRRVHKTNSPPRSSPTSSASTTAPTCVHNAGETHFSLIRPPSASSSTSLHALQLPYHRPYIALPPQSTNTTPTLACALGTCNPSDQQDHLRFTGPSDANSTPSASSATTMQPYPSPRPPPTALHRVLLRTASTPPGPPRRPWPCQDQPPLCALNVFTGSRLRVCGSTTPQDGT